MVYMEIGIANNRNVTSKLRIRVFKSYGYTTRTDVRRYEPLEEYIHTC